MSEKHITVRDKDHIRIAELTERDGITSCEIENRQNDESTLRISILKGSDKVSLITQVENTFTADGREYTIIRPDASISEQKTKDGKHVVQINALEIFYLLKKKYVTAYNSTTGYNHIDTHMVVVLSNGALGLNINGGPVSNPYTKGSAAYALYAVIYGTGWSVGTVDVDGVHDLETDKMNVLENIKEVQKLWGGIIIWDSINKTVSLRDLEKFKPYNGFQVRYGKNTKDIKVDKVANFVTRLYVYGKDNLNIASDNNGLEYIEDFRYTNKIYEDILFNTDIDDPRELKNWGIKQIAKMCQPQITIQTEMIDLRRFKGYTHETFQVNDIVDILNTDVLDRKVYQARIIYRKYDFFATYKCSIEIGDERRKYEDIMKFTLDSSNYMKKVYSPTTNSISSSSINLAGTNMDLTKTNTTNVGNITANRVNISDLYAKNITVTNLIATKATIADLNVTNQLVSTKANISELQATNANIQNLFAKTAQIDNLVATKATIVELNVANANIQNLTSKTANIENLVTQQFSAVNANIQNLTATTATITELNAVRGNFNELNATVARVNDHFSVNLTATNAKIDNLNAGYANITTAVMQKANISSLDAINARFENGTFSGRVQWGGGSISCIGSTVNFEAGGSIHLWAGTVVHGNLSCDNGYTGSFTDKNGKTVIVRSGIITDVR